MDCGPNTNRDQAGTLKTVPCPKSRRFGIKAKRNAAQTTVEFSLICLPFFALLFAIVDYAQIYFYDNSLQNGLRECCRFTTAGRIIQATDASGNGIYETNTGGVVVPKAATDSEGREASRNECSRWWFQSNCVIALPLSNISITSASVVAGQEPTVTTNNGVVMLVSGTTISTNADGVTLSTNITPAVSGPGAADDYVQVTATYNLKTITPLFTYLGGYSRGGWYTYPVRASAIVKNEPALLNFQHTNIYSDEPGYVVPSGS